MGDAAEDFLPVSDTGFIDLVGPLLRRGSTFAFRAEAKHANLPGVVQGGMPMTFADRALGIAAWEATEQRPCVTVSFDMQFVSSARMDEFVTIAPERLRRTRALVFLRGTLLAGERVAGSASGVWSILASRRGSAILSPMSDDDAPAGPPGSALARLTEALGKQRGLPPVEKWNPAYCGEIDMRIAADGRWFYNGTPIGRPALVKLFASILRREEDGRFVLVTPVERVGIAVEDAPFQAVEMAVDGEGEGRTIAFRTDVDDLVHVGDDHALRFETDPEDGGLKPYLHVRRGLWARVTRALAYDLLDLCEERTLDGQTWLGVSAGGTFHRVAPAAEAA